MDKLLLITGYVFAGAAALMWVVDRIRLRRLRREHADLQIDSTRLKTLETLRKANDKLEKKHNDAVERILSGDGESVLRKWQVIDLTPSSSRSDKDT